MLKDLLSLASHGSLGFSFPYRSFCTGSLGFCFMRTCLLVRRV